MRKFDPTPVPPGNYCYRRMDLKPGVSMPSPSGSEFRYPQRERE